MSSVTNKTTRKRRLIVITSDSESDVDAAPAKRQVFLHLAYMHTRYATQSSSIISKFVIQKNGINKIQGNNIKIEGNHSKVEGNYSKVEGNHNKVEGNNNQVERNNNKIEDKNNKTKG